MVSDEGVQLRYEDLRGDISVLYLDLKADDQLASFKALHDLIMLCVL